MIISDENILRNKNEQVSADESKELITLLEKELAHSELMGRPGIGLACPQIGLNKKAAIIRIYNNSSQNLSINLINAKIEKSYNPFIFKGEGCLSFDGKILNTTRYHEICVRNDVEPKKFIATGLLSVAIQHEIDHTNGILFKDRAIDIELKSKIRPNDKCLCGSGQKYKRCCKVNV